MLKNKKVLVTGGAGFIGSALVKKLISLGNQVTVIDNLSRGKKENLKPVWQEVTLIKRDLTNLKIIQPIFENQEIVFNLAALNTGVDYDQGRTQVMFEENMLLQMMPLKAASLSQSVKKFIQISSASVYSREAMDHQVPTPETADTTNPEKSKLGYALAKKMGENLALWYSQNSSLCTISVRFINVYGENDHYDDLGHFIPVMIKKAIEAKNFLKVFGTGKQRRSFLYVDDAVNALLFIAEKGANGEVYNVDASQEKSVKEVVQLILKILNKTKLPIFFDTSKPEGSQRRLLDSNKLQKLGWKAEVDFESGLKRTIQNIQDRLS